MEPRHPHHDARDGAVLYAEQHERILALCMAILHDRADAEDAVQETFARVTPRLRSLDGDPVGYLVVVARNVCRDELRRRSRPVEAAPCIGIEADGDAVERTAVDRSLLRLVWKALPAQERSLLAAVARGASTAEIAAAHGLSIGAVAQRISRARRRARQVVAAPAVLLLHCFGLPRLRRLARVPADVAAAMIGGGQQAERLAAPLLLAIIAGMLGSAGGSGIVPGDRAPQWAAPPSGAMEAVAAVVSAPPKGTAPIRPAARAVAQAAPAAASGGVTPPALQGNRVVSFTASPDYQHDHAVYASTRPEGCTGASCGGLFRSSDGARTWQPLGGAGLLQGTVLLPPHFPRDPTLFAIAPGVSLLRSDDGGVHFQPALPVAPAMAVIEPDSPPGAARIWLLPQAAPGLVVWNQSDGSLRPVTGLPLDVDAVSSLFSVAGGGDVYVNVVEAVGGTSLWACASPGSCRRAGRATGQVPVSAAGPVPGDPFFFLAHPGGVEVRTASGSRDWQLDTGSGSTVQAILPAADFARSGQFDVVARGAAAAVGQALQVRRFASLGGVLGSGVRTWAPPEDTALMLRLPDGRLLAALAPVAAGGHASGLLCSADDGGRWAAAC
jgi:RNA polymerase sigma-70 factor (ECF subfamily)